MNRRKAQRFDIKVIETLGVQLLINKRGLLSADSTWSKIKQLSEVHGLYVSPDLLGQIQKQLLGAFFQ